HFGSAGSNFRNFGKSTVGTSAAPIGSPGWAGFGCLPPSIASARMAFAMRSCSARESGRVSGSRNAAAGGVIRFYPLNRAGIAPETFESMRGTSLPVGFSVVSGWGREAAERHFHQFGEGDRG